MEEYDNTIPNTYAFDQNFNEGDTASRASVSDVAVTTRNSYMGGN